MAAVLQAVGVPFLLIVSLGYLLFACWASDRGKEEVQREQNSTDPGEVPPPE